MIKIKTKRLLTDITDLVISELKMSPEKTRFVNLFSKHTTAGIKILEHEKLLLSDYERFLEDVAPRHGYYAHDILEAREVPKDEPINGHSHIKALFFNASKLIPVISDGSKNYLDVGKWQRIFLVDADFPRERQIRVDFI